MAVRVRSVAELLGDGGEAGPVLGVFAHPDDETMSAGGTLAWLSRQGVRVAVACATLGQAGSTGNLCPRERLGEVRQGELREACRILGVHEVETWAFEDARLERMDRSVLKERALESLRARAPAAVLTHPPTGGDGHPDHVAVSRATTEAFFDWVRGDPGVRSRLYYAVFPVALQKEVLRRRKYQFRPIVALPATHRLPTRWLAGVKLEAARAHKTQFPMLSRRGRFPLRALFWILGGELLHLAGWSPSLPTPPW